VIGAVAAGGATIEQDVLVAQAALAALNPSYFSAVARM